MELNNEPHRTRGQNGSTLMIAMALVLVIGIVIPLLVEMVINESRWTIRERKSSVALSMAQAGINQGLFFLTVSTANWAQAISGAAIPSYNFDQTYNLNSNSWEPSPGVFRIRISSGPQINQVTILAEGRGLSTQVTRAIQAVYQQTLPGAWFSQAQITMAGQIETHWGPVTAGNAVVISSNTDAAKYFPRKLAKTVVVSTDPLNPRDINGLDPPNTDNVEWWSNYPVPDLPVLDFVSIQARAIANNAYNVFGCPCAQYFANGVPVPFTSNNTVAAHLAQLGDPGGSCADFDHSRHFDDAIHYQAAQSVAGAPFLWDSDVVFTGTGTVVNCNGLGIVGNVFTRGASLTISTNTAQCLNYLGHVPTNAWMEYQKIDTGGPNQYPAQAGFHNSNPTYQFGGADAYFGGTTPPVGIHGFVYVEQNLNLNNPLNVHGALWVVGNVTSPPGSAGISYVFYDDAVFPPATNIVLSKQSWQKVATAPLDIATPW